MDETLPWCSERSAFSFIETLSEPHVSIPDSSSVPRHSNEGTIRFAIAVLERVVLIAIAIPYVLAIFASLPSHPSFLLSASSEILAAFFVLIQKPGTVSTRALAVAAAYGGTVASLLVRPGGPVLLPSEIASLMMAAGLALAVWSKIVLNRSFGLVAANRGVKKRGPYRLVRHPMYLGYVLAQVGFLSQNMSAFNVMLYAVGWSLQLLRIREEEHILAADPLYKDYRKHVRWKLLPGLL